MKTPRALFDRTTAGGSNKSIPMVLGQEWRGIVAKRRFDSNHFAVAGNARLKAILHIVSHRGNSNTSRKPYSINNVSATQVNCPSISNPLLGFNV